VNSSDDVLGSLRIPATELLTATDAKEKREGREGTASNDAVLTSRVRIGGWSFLVLAALIDTIAGRHAMNPDGISYLDMGDAMVRGDWKMAVNGHWSPLYPWLQGVALRLVHPSAYTQFTVVHFVNLLIFLFALASFEFLLRAAVAQKPGSQGVDGESSRIPDWALFAVGYAIFFWASISLTMMARVSPDLLMAAFLYLAVGVLLRIWSQPESFSWFVLLGAVLGVGYLAKAPFFPLAFVFFAVAWILARGRRRAVPRLLAGLVVFLAVSGPWVVALSHAKGRFMFGDSGRLNQVLWVDGASPSYYFQNLGMAGGHYTHPVRQIFNSPPIYEFASPIKGTLPVWYDPSYWSDGAVPRISLKRQLAVFFASLEYCFDLLFSAQAALLAAFIIVCVTAGRDRIVQQLAAGWPVWLMGLVGLGMYALVHVELRYLAAFFALFWVGLFSGLEVPSGRVGRRLAALVTLAVVVIIAGPPALTVAAHLRKLHGGQPDNQWQVAHDLQRLGVKPGDRVARIGGNFGVVYWARLLGVTVVAEVPGPNSMDFWNANPEVQAQVIEKLQGLGTTAIIADMTDLAQVPGPEWHKLGDGYFARMIATTGGHRAQAREEPDR
jgi:hypothetical protein